MLPVFTPTTCTFKKEKSIIGAHAVFRSVDPGATAFATTWLPETDLLHLMLMSQDIIRCATAKTQPMPLSAMEHIK